MGGRLFANGWFAGIHSRLAGCQGTSAGKDVPSSVVFVAEKLEDASRKRQVGGSDGKCHFAPMI